MPRSRRKDRLAAQYNLLRAELSRAAWTDEVSQRYASLDEKNRHLMTAFTRKLHDLQSNEAFDPGLATVLAAHVHVRGSTLHSTISGWRRSAASTSAG